MFLHNIEVTTIDIQGTKKREDGFAVDMTTKDICTVTVIPDWKHCNIDSVVEAAEIQRSKRKHNKHFFDRKESGLSHETPHEVLVLTMKAPDYETAEFSFGTATIRRSYTFEEADACTDDEELQAFREYAIKEYGEAVNSDQLVATANWKTNSSVQTAMNNLHIPYLCHHNGKISIRTGYCKINSPIRDVVSLINMFQFSHYLETEKILFTKEELLRFTSEQIEPVYNLDLTPTTEN